MWPCDELWFCWQLSGASPRAEMPTLHLWEQDIGKDMHLYAWDRLWLFVHLFAFAFVSSCSHAGKFLGVVNRAIVRPAAQKQTSNVFNVQHFRFVEVYSLVQIRPKNKCFHADKIKIISVFHCQNNSLNISIVPYFSLHFLELFFLIPLFWISFSVFASWLYLVS